MLVVARRSDVRAVFEEAVVRTEREELVGLVGNAYATNVFVVVAVDCDVVAVGVGKACREGDELVEQVVRADFACAVNRALTFRAVCEVSATREEEADLFGEFVGSRR